jgi:peptidoglycan/LPS O-acetylase OafA/YrhL
VARSKNDALTGARALAGVYILFMHFGAPLFRRAPHWARTLRESGYVATSFFLMLSGFVLTYAYGKKLADGRINRRHFLIQRISRLYPSYLLALALMLPFTLFARLDAHATAFGPARTRWKILTGLLHASMSHVWFPRFVTSWNIPGWCVSVEMWFYLAFPVAVVWALGRSTRTLWATLAVLWGVALTLSLSYTLARPDDFTARVESVGFYLSLYKFSPPSRLPEFLFGVMLGALYARRPDGERLEKWATPMLAVGGVLALSVLLNGDKLPYSMMHNGMLLPLYGMIVWALMAGYGPLHRLLSLPPLVKMGDASYQLYILQVPLMMWLVVLGGRTYGYGGQDPGFVALALPLVITGALLIQRFYQPRAQEFLKSQLEQRWRPTPTVATIELPLAPVPEGPQPAPVLDRALTLPSVS